MKKLYWTRALKLVALVIPLVLLLMIGHTTLAVRGNHNTVRLRGFYEEPENSLDVVFIGASDIFTGFSPVYAYDQFGYTSYMYAINGCPGSLYSYFLNEVLSRQDPQLIVVEVHGYLHEDDYLEREAPRRYFAESTPWSANKVKAILNFEGEKSKLSYFIPFAKYHGEWKNISEIEENRRYRKEIFGHPTILKGSTTTLRNEPLIPDYEVQNDYSKRDLDEKTYETLMEFIRICKQQDLKNVVFVRFPHPIKETEDYEKFQRANTLEQIVTEQGFRFINLERKVEDIGIDYVKDYYDRDHLNLVGQKKLTKYLGGLIREEYITEPREQSAENKARWDLSVQYLPLLWEKAKQCKIDNNLLPIFESPKTMEELNESYHMGKQ